MSEKELLEKIEQSAKELEVPGRLCPEKIKKTIYAKRRRMRLYKVLTLAAVSAACIMLCIPLTQMERNSEPDMVKGKKASAEGMAGAGDQSEAAEAGSSILAETEDIGDAAKEAAQPKQDAGSLFTVAKGYDEFYDVLKERESRYVSDYTAGMEEDRGVYSGGMADGAVTSDTAVNFEYKLAATETAKAESLSSEDYSRTNLQTTGVDESDFVKTDGKLVYVVKDNSIVMADVSGSRPVKKGKIVLPDENSSDDVLEMYVDEGILNVIVQREKTDLKKEGSEGYGNAEDVYRLDTDIVTEILTYDIKNPSEPVLRGSMQQDGYYQSSRKIGDLLYLFTTKRTELPSVPRKQAVLEEEAGGWIPLVNGKAVAPGCIYLSESGTEGLLISSVNVKRPKETVDAAYILNDYADIYVSQEALYLYYPDYRADSGSRTNIAKFSLNKGRINAVGASSVTGTVRDAFAVNESSDAKLRVLTTTDGWNSDEGNNLYILDENLKLTGKLTGIAPGEQIYAARFFGDTAYFVTYRNTDPLFAADLSDDTNPKLIGELKITGFSEYLHFWGDDKLVGIGYETDPDSGERKGMKAVMFDISDPADLKEIRSMILKDVDYSDALYNYKSVLADAEQNLLGFPTESYEKKEMYGYLLFTWDGSSFKELLAEPLGEEAAGGSRGMYIGDKFIIVTTGNIKVFDRKKGYEFVANLVL